MTDINPYVPTAEPERSRSSGGSGRRDFLRRLARAQRKTNAAALVYLAMIPITLLLSRIANGAQWGRTVNVLLALGVVLFGGFTVFKLGELLRGKMVAAVYVILLLVPYLGLVVLLVVSSQATSKLKRHHVRVGLLGADPEEI